MSNFDDTNRGAMWRNKDKRTDTDRDFQGSINVGGVEYWISGWSKKEDESPNAPVVRFSIQAKEAVHKQGVEQVKQNFHQPPQQSQQAPSQSQPPQQSQPQAEKTTQSHDNFNDDIPW